MQAWILPALNTDKPTRLYTFAALYAAPALLQLHQPHSGATVMYLLCALHIQVLPRSVPEDGVGTVGLWGLPAPRRTGH